ncbi:MAG: acyl-CoA dehydrogenase family protein [Bacteroidota bacterium]
MTLTPYVKFYDLSRMQIGWNTSQLELREECAEFGRRQVAAEVRTNAAVGQFDEAAWQELCSTNFWKWALPEAYGGQGRSWWDFAAGLEGLASTAADGGFVMSVIGQAWTYYALLKFGTEAQKHRYIPRLLAGEVAATAIAEPHSGTDVPNLRTQAVKDGDGYRLHGDKQNISHAAGKGFSIVVGRIPALGDRDITLFLCEQGAPGYHAHPLPVKTGLNTLPTYNLRFRDLQVHENQILGEKGRGLRCLGSFMMFGRALIGIAGAALLEPVLDQALTYIRDRQSGGKPLREHQYVQRRIADLQILASQAQYTSYGALSRVLSADPEAPMLASIAKIAATQTLLDGSRELLALLGSRGFLEGPAGHLAKDALGFIAVGGTEELHRKLIFRSLMQRKKRW